MEKKQWDDIPSLEGLQVDWQYQPENPLGKRSFVRMSDRELLKMFDGQHIPVKIATTKTNFIGSLLDICEGGLAVNLPVALAENQAIRVGFHLGMKKIISRAQVRYIRQCGQGYITGIMFVHLDTESREFIAGIYASRVLKHCL